MVSLAKAAPESALAGRKAALGAAGSIALHASILAGALLAAFLFNSAVHLGGDEPTDAIEVALEAPVADLPAPPVARTITPPPAPRAPVSSAPSDLAAQPPEDSKPVPQPAPVAAPQPVAAAPAPARSASTATISPKARDSYVAALMSWLNRFKQYPPDARRERVQGIVVVRFTIDSSGRVFSSSIARSSGHPALDQAALDMFTRASPLPQPPQSFMRGEQTTLTLPVEFSLITR